MESVRVSSYNNSVDWKKVAGHGVKYAFVRATEGATFQDTKFKEYIDGMKKNSIRPIPYHVFKMSSEPEEQLQNIRNTLKQANLDPKLVKLAVATNLLGEKEYPNQEIAEKLNSLLVQLSNAGFPSLIIYAKTDIWNNRIAQEDYKFSDYSLWLHSYNGEELNIPKDWKEAEKTYEYRSSGIEKDVDGIKDEAKGEVSIVERNPIYLDPPSKLEESQAESALTALQNR